MSAEPTFAELAAELLDYVRHQAQLNALAEPFLAGLPHAAPGISHAWEFERRRLMRFAKLQDYLARMVGHEDAIRAMAGLPHR